MAEDIQVRMVRVEFLRAGPAHNQLLSPLTPYLAICDDAEAGVVNVPFEQHTFERRMRALRHEEQDVDPGNRPALKDRLPDLRELGVAMARLLGSVPRFPGSLAADPNGRDTIVRVSLTLSAAELAGLPFELAKVPIGPDACTESWLSVQSKVPVVITRRTRNVSITKMTWLEAPRILFIVAGEASGELPYREHLEALMAAVKPFARSERFGRKPRLVTTPDGDGKDVRRSYGDMLTVLTNATLAGVIAECTAHAYTHVHILAHGSQDDSLGDRSYGLLLHPDDGVISGERLASALGGMVHGQLHKPQVVTLATCDSAASRDVTYPGASLAHALHQAGVALVVASQVPLGFDGSVIFARQFYEGLLWGEHPWVVMHRVRTTLHGQLNPMDHDWASLVVYESLPSDMSAALEHATFQQCKRAVEVAYSSGNWVGGPALDRAIDRLIANGQTYAMEARALRADTLMINARDEMTDVDAHPHARTEAELHESFQYRRACMEDALADYDAAVSGFLVTPGQGLNAPFRALLSKLSIRIVLGLEVDWGEWHVARYWADNTVARASDPEALSWAQACLCELWLLKLMEPLGRDDAETCLRRATAAMRETLQSRVPLDSFAGSSADWLDYRLCGYVDAWVRPELRQVSAGWDDVAGTRPGLDLAPLSAAADRLLQRLRSQLGPQPDGPAAAPTPASPPVAERPNGRPGPTAPAGRRAEAATRAATVAAAPADPAPAPAPVPVAAAPTAPDAASVPSATPAAPAADALLGKTTVKPARKPASGPAAPKPPALPADPLFDVEMLPVAQGDALWVEWGSRSGQRWRLLVDCGTEDSFKRALGPRIARQASDAASRRFELFILSHIDGDHIGGGIPLLQQAKGLGVSFGDIWFNGRQHLERVRLLSGKDGDDFSQLLRREKLPWNLWTQGQAVVRPDGDGLREGALPTVTLAGGMQVTLLSPVPSTLQQLAGTWDADLAQPGKRRTLATRVLDMEEDLDVLASRPFDPDDSRPNGSSIAVLLRYAGKTALLGADAYADVLATALRRLKPSDTERVRLDLFKLPHHGSRGNVNDALMALVDCANYGVSTSGAIFNHPDREALARVVRRSVQRPTLWFNYPVPEKTREYQGLWARPEVQERWRFDTRYPADETSGQRISLFPVTVSAPR